MARDFKIELDNVEMINGSDDLLKDTKVTKVTLTGENKLNSLNSTFENCTELTSIEGEINLDGISDMTEMTLNTTLDELKIINPTEENIQADNSLNQVTNVKIGGTKYAKGGIQDVVGSLDWNAENFVYEDTILDNIYSDSSYSEDSKNLTISNTLEQKATSIEITGQTYENLVDGKATKNLLDEMSMQQTEGKPTQFTPHMEQPICVESIEGETYQNLIEGKGEYNLTNKATFIPLGLQPNKDYTLQLDSVGKNDKPITVNLGGTEATVQPINDTSKHHKVVVRTPSTLTTDKLDLNGEGVVVNDVMLFEGGSNEIKQEVEYVEGIQNIGELQEDGTYKIDILTKGNENIWDWNYYIGRGVPSYNASKEEMTYSIDKSCSNFYVEVQGDTSYNIKIYDKRLDGSGYDNRIAKIIYLDKNKKYIREDVAVYIGSHSFTTDKECKYLLCSVQYGNVEVDVARLNCRIILKSGQIKEYVPPQISTQSILLPQPLNKIGEIKDKFYWDDNKGHYCIEQNLISYQFNGLEEFGLTPISQIRQSDYYRLVFIPDDIELWKNNSTVFSSYSSSKIDWNLEAKNTYSAPIGEGGRYGVLFAVHKNDLLGIESANAREWIRKEKPYIIRQLSNPKIIDLPHLNKKYSLDTYMPTTYVDVTNLPLQPYGLLLEDDTVRYKSTIEPSTLYTIQFNCLSKLTTRLTLDLGGSRVTVDPIIGVNHVQITTPSELTSDRLFLIGTGIVVKEVIVNKGDMRQYPKYFDGEHSVGELQTDGSYKIVIKTNESFTVTIRTSSPLTKSDKIYWNDIDKRYEIDRNGVIEVPTVEGDIINLPRLYQREDTTISISTDNIKPSKIAIEYNDINNN